MKITKPDAFTTWALIAAAVWLAGSLTYEASVYRDCRRSGRTWWSCALFNTGGPPTAVCQANPADWRCPQ